MSEIQSREFTVTAEPTEGLAWHSAWAEGKYGEFGFTLSCGAGVGGTGLRLAISGPGKYYRTERIEMAGLFEAWVKAMCEEAAEVLGIEADAEETE